MLFNVFGGKAMKHTGIIQIVRTEQWEYTAYYGKGKKSKRAVGSSESTAERNLLRKMVFWNR
jgi:hypothetical protein